MKARTNPYCDGIGIGIPRLEVAKGHPDANYYSLLIVVLLERGEPVTLREAAQRFEEAGVAPAAQALASLKRCKPGRSPIYRDGDRYALDPHDAEADLWAFRLGLRPSKAVSPEDRPAPEPLPTVDAPLTAAYLDEAWRDGVPTQLVGTARGSLRPGCARPGHGSGRRDLVRVGAQPVESCLGQVGQLLAAWICDSSTRGRLLGTRPQPRCASLCTASGHRRDRDRQALGTPATRSGGNCSRSKALRTRARGARQRARPHATGVGARVSRQGTRITVEFVLEELAAGQAVEALTESHPTITMDGVRAALDYAAKVQP